MLKYDFIKIRIDIEAVLTFVENALEIEINLTLIRC